MNLQNIKLDIIGPCYVGFPLAVEFGKQRFLPRQVLILSSQINRN